MEPNQYKDLFSTQAGDYARFRPHYPSALFKQLGKLCAAHELAWDCGTGNGQAAVALAPYFKKVIGTDPSEKQLESAVPHEKVEYRRAGAEVSGIEAGSVDLITVAQAFHWFRQEEFFAECSRVAKPGCLLAVWCYELTVISPEVDRVVKVLYEDVLGSYWDPARKRVEEGYRNEVFPFPEITGPKVSMGAEWTLPDLIGYLGTWSSFQKYYKEKGFDPRVPLMPNFIKAWGNQNVPKNVSWPLSLRLFRVRE
jgi:SAM-dependent methyltransferase